MVEMTKRERVRVGSRRRRAKIQVVVEGYFLSSVDSPLLDLHALVKKISGCLCGMWNETFE